MTQIWIQDPFLLHIDCLDDSDVLKDDPVELQPNDRIPLEFERCFNVHNVPPHQEQELSECKQ